MHDLSEKRSRRSIREDPSTNEAKKPPLETRKSGEELKLRLASAMSVKIALNKDGRNSSSNRGIRFLLQRKEQEENKLNTKDISFQKPLRNSARKGVETASNTSMKGARNGINKTELQKSLLSALMNSRAPSGINSSKTGLSGQLNSDKSSPRELNKTQTSKASSENVSQKLINGERSRESGIEGTTALENKNEGVGELHKMMASKAKTTREQAADELPTKSSNSTNNGILDRAKKIERLLGQRKPLKPNGKDIESNREILNTSTEIKGEITLANKPVENGRTSTVLREKDKQNNSVSNIANKSKLLDSLKKRGNILNGKQSGNVQLDSTAKPIENASINGKSNGLFKTVDKRASLEAFGKKIPPPIAKKPSKEEMQRSKQDSQLSRSGSSIGGKVSSRNEAAITSQNHLKKNVGKGDVFTADVLNSKKEEIPRMNFGKNIEFREDLLEKLEANVGHCKITGLQSIEEFSVLRTKVYRLRAELDKLKLDREKRMPLVS